MSDNRSFPTTGVFRTPQSFSLFSARHLLDKLRWDLSELERLRWDEELGDGWRQVVSYKAIDCATTIWHLLDWFSAEVVAIEPLERLRAYLGIKTDDRYSPISLSDLRKAAFVKCPDLEICRVVAIASKHYEIKQQRPRPDIRTAAYLAMAQRGDEPFKRPVMWIAVFENETRRDMRLVLFNGLHLLEELAYVASPGSTWIPGVPIPSDVHLPMQTVNPPVLPSPVVPTTGLGRILSALKGLRIF